MYGSGDIRENRMDDSEKAKLAASQEAKMKNFFAGLNGNDRRILRRAAQKVIGRKESMSEMIARLSRKPQ